MLLEDDLYGLQVEFGGHVADRAIFVVELLCGVGAFFVAFDEMLEHLPVADEVAAEVHRHESGELEEARVNLAAGRRRNRAARLRSRCSGTSQADARVASVLTAVGASARVDRPAHHRQGLGPPSIASSAFISAMAA